MPRWSWENIWSVWSVCSLLVFPFLAAFYTVPALALGYHEVAAPVIARVVFYGIRLGIAQVLFGLHAWKESAWRSPSPLSSAARLALGTLVPFIRLHSELLFTAAGGSILAGIFFVACGMVFALSQVSGEKTKRVQRLSLNVPPIRTGLIIASVSGLCAGFMNIGISFAAPLEMAAKHGTKPYWSLNARGRLSLVGGAVPNLAYCVHLFIKRRSLAAGPWRIRNVLLLVLLCIDVCALVWW